MSEIEIKKNILFISNNGDVLKRFANYFYGIGISIEAFGNIPEGTLENGTTIVGNLRDASLINFVIQQYKPDYIIYFINDAVRPEAMEKKLGPYIEAMSNTLNLLQCLKNYNNPCSLLCASYNSAKKDAVSDSCTQNNHFNMQNMSYADAMNMLETYLDIGTSCNILINSYKKSFFTSAYNSHIFVSTISYDEPIYDTPKNIDSFLLQCRRQLENMGELT
ncbi:hypothetical protein SAMN02745248_01522 [Hathewaya proteolytica DSM 3090]|uniref:Uncharacterized protein n=1 Tax=Hathewaya proteolytica DSM 3090 TaxID=1121331 RepID=A0A1M6NW74_9CLOT|nr:hypothetical protein [Hathewaya proteolytica]SHJ99900.1 hypothetical protein SAMN02745248_01522 [Hathewaya proteolytica DSM 3090]